MDDDEPDDECRTLGHQAGLVAEMPQADPKGAIRLIGNADCTGCRSHAARIGAHSDLRDC